MLQVAPVQKNKNTVIMQDKKNTKVKFTKKQKVRWKHNLMP